MRLKRLRTFCALCLLMKSLTAWPQDDRKIEVGQKAPFDGVLMSDKNYRKTDELLTACDIFRKHITEPKPCVDLSEKEKSNGLTYFLGGIIGGFLLGTFVK